MHLYGATIASESVAMESVSYTHLTTVTHPKVLGVTSDQQLRFNEHITQAASKANKTLNILKAISGKEWGKSNETILTTYNAITKSHLEYACTVWGPNVAQTNLSKLDTIQNSALRIATGCTKDTNTDYLYQETKTLPIKAHIQLHSSTTDRKLNTRITHPST